ncbi:hypothetical protein PIB30_000339 [Stylosanthes scabra]|uniref:Uncharacterized protein n=1 Tax=Stylosanthes scabra TaxID=79078 RepID=A0ABU6T2K8_9FABA|nr:hypothetical protein [Stylosanthes scabra]
MTLGTPNLGMILFDTNFRHWAAVIDASDSASTHLVKWSMATIRYLTYPGPFGKGPRRSIPHLSNGQGSFMYFCYDGGDSFFFDALEQRHSRCPSVQLSAHHYIVYCISLYDVRLSFFFWKCSFFKEVDDGFFPAVLD